MNIRVECYAGHRGAETPGRFFFDERSVDVVQVIDQWHGEDYRYFKILGSDQATYILRHNVPGQGWEMTMYQSPSGQMRQ